MARVHLSLIPGIALLCCLSFAVAEDRPRLSIHWIDVEGGAATLVTTAEGESLLMDCGWPGPRDAERIAKAAKEAGVARIDHFLISHWHTDHWGGVEALAARIPIARYYDHGFPEGEQRDIDAKLKAAYLQATGGRSTVLKPGDTVPLKGASVKIVAAHGLALGESRGAPQIRACKATPAHEDRPEDISDNARSLGFVLRSGDFELVDLGDLTWNVEHKLVCPENLLGAALDVYQSTHHGLEQSNHPALLAAAQPTVVVMNNGAKKGGQAEAYRRFKAVASVRDIFQIHRNVATTPADNAPPELVANDEETCEGHGIRLTLAADGQTYTVEVPSKGTKRSYAVR